MGAGQVFYQLLTYTDDVDMNRKLAAWEQYYNFDRPHGAFAGKTAYEVLTSLLNLLRISPAGYGGLHY